ncbi:MAG: SURF1 family protein [Alphaproteobacteria bacterium]|nr:SURF1 family protein [Alphaproteobacteria bacterium]
MLSFLILVILLGLGSWQIARLEWKLNLIAERAAMLGATPIEISQKSDLLSLRRDKAGQYTAWQPVRLKGHFLANKTVFLGNKFVGETSGFDVLVPFQLIDGAANKLAPTLILVDQGFIAWSKNGNYNPKRIYHPPVTEATADAEIKPQEISGWIVPAAQPGWFTPAAKPDQSLWYVADLSDVAAKIPELKSLQQEFLVGLAPEAANDSKKTVDANRPHPQALMEIPNPHLGYALTWFGLAAIWLGFCAVFWFKMRRSAS